MDPDTDNSRLFCDLEFSESGEKTVTLTATLDGKTVGAATAKTTMKVLKTVVELDTLSLWSPESPTLYDLTIEVTGGWANRCRPLLFRNAQDRSLTTYA